MYIHKSNGSKISNESYNTLTLRERKNWVLLQSDEYEDDDSMLDDVIGLGTSIAIGAMTDSAILGGLLGGDMTGGIIGDLFDGDLMD